MLAVGIYCIKACCVNGCSLGTFPDTTGETEYFVNNDEWDLIEIKWFPVTSNGPAYESNRETIYFKPDGKVNIYCYLFVSLCPRWGSPWLPLVSS